MNNQEIEQKLKETLLQYLDAGKKVTLTWDCGGDEAFVHVFIDNEEQSSFEDGKYQAHKFPALLEDFVILKLGLPSAGEFSLKGKGEIFKENNTLTILYEVVEFEDYEEDEEYPSDGAEEFSGREVLFNL